MRRYALPVSIIRGSLPNRPSQAAGQIAAARPTVSVSANTMAPPISAMRSARASSPAPILVPTSATSGPPKPNASGTIRYSSRTPVPKPATATPPPWAPTSAVVSSTVRLVCSDTTAAMAPTRKMSMVRSRRSRAGLNCRMQRPDRM